MKNRKINIKLLHVNKKPLAKKGNLFKQNNRPIMNYEWIRQTIPKKNPIPKKKMGKSLKIKMKLTHVDKKNHL